MKLEMKLSITFNLIKVDVWQIYFFPHEFLVFTIIHQIEISSISVNRLNKFKAKNSFAYSGFT